MPPVRLPDWWTYPAECPAGHPWGPGRVIVAFTPCACKGGAGHTRVHCGTKGCREVWYDPPHDGRAASAYPPPVR